LEGDARRAHGVETTGDGSVPILKWILELFTMPYYSESRGEGVECKVAGAYEGFSRPVRAHRRATKSWNSLLLNQNTFAETHADLPSISFPFSVMQCLGEMAIYAPISGASFLQLSLVALYDSLLCATPTGGYVHMAERYIRPSAGLALRWMN
jgi:hypothetical protein